MKDLPARLVTLSTSILHRDRNEWGLAMSAELAQLTGNSERWQFAFGCMWAAITAPPHPDANAPGIRINAMLLAGVAGCVATTAYVLSTWRQAADDISLGTWAGFAAALATYLWFALRPPGPAVSHGNAARKGAAIGVALFVVGALGRTVIDEVVPPSNGDAIVGLFLTVVVLSTLGISAFLVARAEGSFGAAVTSSLWIGLVCSILAFNADVIAILIRFNLDTHMRHSMPEFYTLVTPDAFLGIHIGEHLASAMDGLRTLPLLALLAGAIGAMIGRTARRSLLVSSRREH